MGLIKYLWIQSMIIFSCLHVSSSQIIRPTNLLIYSPVTKAVRSDESKNYLENLFQNFAFKINSPRNGDASEPKNTFWELSTRTNVWITWINSVTYWALCCLSRSLLTKGTLSILTKGPTKVEQMKGLCPRSYTEHIHFNTS